MPRKFLHTREEVIAAALELTRERGMEAVTARSLGARLGSSSKPIFSLFKNMEEVTAEVISAAEAKYQEFMEGIIAGGEYPPYKASGMAYIRFAAEERELFKLLFMRDRSGEVPKADDRWLEPIIDTIMANTGLDRENARLFHLEMWMFTHGIATTIATAFYAWDMEFVSRILTDCYSGLRHRFCGEGKV